MPRIDREVVEEFHLTVRGLLQTGFGSYRDDFARIVTECPKVVRSIHKTHKNDEDIKDHTLCLEANAVHRAALYVAQKYGKQEVINKLLALGLDPKLDVNLGFLDRINHIADKPFDAAVKTALQKFIVDNGVDINTTHPENGYAALHRAVSAKNYDLVLALLEFGADINIKVDQDSYNTFAAVTPLHCALECLDESMVELLCFNGADIHMLTRYGKTVSEFATHASESFGRFINLFVVSSVDKLTPILDFLNEFTAAMTVENCVEDVPVSGVTDVQHDL